MNLFNSINDVDWYKNKKNKHTYINVVLNKFYSTTHVCMLYILNVCTMCSYVCAFKCN